MYALAISEVMLSRNPFFITVIDSVTGTFAALRTSVIQTCALYGAGKRSQAVRRDRRTIFAEKSSRVVFDRISLAEVATQKPIIGDDFKVSQTRQPWLRF
jgi:hypothetical protein